MTQRVWQLRAMSVAELLDGTIRLYRKNFLTFVAIVAVLYVPLVVVNGLLAVPLSQAAEEVMAFDPYTFDPETMDPAEMSVLAALPPGMGRYYAWTGVQFLVSVLLGGFVISLITGAMAWAISERYQDRPVTVGLAYRAVLRRWKSLLGATILTTLIYVALYVAVLIPCIGQIAALPLLVFSYTCLRFVPQAVMIEEQRARDSLGRSWFLAKPHFWRVLGIVVLLWIFGTLITAGPSMVFSFGIVAVSTSILVRNLVATAVSALLNLIYLPLRLGGETLLYYDLRVRQEGLDLEMEIDSLARPDELDLEGELASPEPVPPLPTPTPARESFLIGRDWRNLALLLGVGVILMILCCLAYFAFVAVFAMVNLPAMDQIMETLPTLTPPP